MFATLTLTAPTLGAQEQRIPLTEVPAAAMAAAKAAVEGLQIASAVTEVERGKTVYELTGAANGVAYELEVTADGQVLEIQTDESDDDEDDSDEDDEDENRD